MKPLTLGELHAGLEAEGLALPPLSNWTAALAQEDPAPWFVRVLVGFGAWIAALMGVGALTAILTISHNQGAWIILGLLLCGGAVLLRRSSQHDFAVQAALALSLAGQVMVFAGLEGTAGFTHRDFGLFGALLILELLLIAFHRDPVHRFLSALAAGLCLDYLLSALLRLAWGDGQAPGSDLAWLPLLLRAALPGALLLVWWLRPKRLWLGEAALCLRPVGYGLACAYLWPIVQARTWLFFGSHGAGFPALREIPWSMARILPPLVPGLLLAVAGFVVLRRLELDRGRPLLLACLAWVGLAGLGLWIPGLPAVFMLMALAIEAQEGFLFALAGLAGAFLLSTYYYSLALTLLAKSGVLAASGLLLLGLAVLLRAPKEAP